MAYDSYAMFDEYDAIVDVVDDIEKVARPPVSTRQPRRKNEHSLKVRRKLEDYFDEKRLEKELSLYEYDLES